MCDLRRLLTLCLLAGGYLVLLGGQAWAYEVSAAGGCSSPDADPDAKGFYDKVKGYPNWSGNYYKKYSNCQETQYKRAGSGGSENSWIDTSDIHYHVSHGGGHWDWYYWRYLTAVIFDGVTGNAKYLDPSEARSAWGNNNLEWIGFRCCRLLNNASWKYWAKAMNRLHLILGFKTVSYVANNYGSEWGKQMRKRTINIGPWKVTFSRTVTQAWFGATDKTQPVSVVARVIAETYKCYQDHLHGNGSVCADPSPDRWKWRWDHRARPSGFGYLPVNNLSRVRVYEVVPRDVDESYVREIGEAFGFGYDHDVNETEDLFIMARLDDPGDDPNDPNSPSHLLEVFKNSGQYYYHDLGRLWKWDPCDYSPIYPAGDACSTAYGFLTDVGHINLMPGDAGMALAGFDEIVKEDVDYGTSTAYFVNRSVTYPREIEAGGEVVTVAGPGGGLKVYIDPSGDIIGAMGNWREVEEAGSVPVMTRQQAWDLFKQEGQEACVAPINIEYDDVQTDANTATQGYYEYSGTELQDELIPVWIFEVDYLKDGNSVLTAYAHIPSATTETEPEQASSPWPTDGAAGVSRDVVLSWTPGIHAARHDVYFSSDFDDVNDATSGSAAYEGQQDVNSWDPPGLLEPHTSYYWRIDEVNYAPPNVWKGEVWRFTTGEPNFVYLGAEAVGDGTYRHSYKLSNVGGSIDLYDIETHFVYNPAWFSIYGPDEWNLHFIGFITTWQTGQSPCVVDSEQFGYHVYAGGPEVQEAYYTLTDVDHVVVADGNTSVPTEGLFCAYAPYPSNGAAEANPNVSLSWTPGCLASSHDVYFGTNWDDVNDAITLSGEYKGNFGPNSYDPGGLDLDTTYYWRIDEANGATANLWKGNVWSFTTGNYLVVDDMESYDPFVNTIYYTWDPDWTGAYINLAIHPNEPVHGGGQAMWYEYDNTGFWFEYYSEITAETGGGLDQLQIGPDWTEEGVQALTLYFYGDPNNDANATEQMYVGLEDSRGAGSYAEVRYGDSSEDMNDIRKEEWTEWNIPLTDFTDVILTEVAMVYIGFGDRSNPQPGGSGIVYFDDIRLYQPRCMPLLLRPAADLNEDCVVDHKDLRIMAGHWLGTEESLADLYADDETGETNFRDYCILADGWLEEKQWPEP
ncbi:MAG: DUF6345 domain-containing protein [Planctomycetota bacterium]|jgi:hypothetical protein